MVKQKAPHTRHILLLLRLLPSPAQLLLLLPDVCSVWLALCGARFSVTRYYLFGSYDHPN